MMDEEHTEACPGMPATAAQASYGQTSTKSYWNKHFYFVLQGEERGS